MVVAAAVASHERSIDRHFGNLPMLFVDDHPHTDVPPFGRFANRLVVLTGRLLHAERCACARWILRARAAYTLRMHPFRRREDGESGLDLFLQSLVESLLGIFVRWLVTRLQRPLPGGEVGGAAFNLDLLCLHHLS